MKKIKVDNTDKQKKIELGSRTAIGGFLNEKAICEKFNNWQKDSAAQIWLKVMGYNIKKINNVKAVQIPVRISKKDIYKFGISEDEYEEFTRYKKADAQLTIIITIGNIMKIENLSLKKANPKADYNQIDKRDVSSYQGMCKFDDEIAFWLRLFTGDLDPGAHHNEIGSIILRDERRIFFDQMPETIQKKIIKFFDDNRICVISDIIRGRGGLSADWMLVTRFDENTETSDWTLHDINSVMNFFGSGEIKLSPRGSLTIGKVTLQRKGGTPDPTKLQFKINPCNLFELDV